MLTDASQKVTTQKLLLVAHSQGNFYANAFYDTVLDASGGVPGQSIGVYSVATPADRVAGNGLYLTSDTDHVIDPIPSILKPNVHINFQASDDGGLGHDFSKIYLAYQGDKIVSDIKTTLSKLQNNNIQDENSSCLNPPKLTLAQKAQGLALHVVDPVSIPVQTAIVNTAVTSYKIGSAISNAYLAFVNGAGAMLANAFGGLAKINSAAVINSVDNSSVAIDALNQTTPEARPIGQTTAEATPPPQESNPMIVQLADATTTPPAAASINSGSSTPLLNQGGEGSVSSPPSVGGVPAGSGGGGNAGLETTNSTSQNLYADLLPGGGGVASGNTTSSNFSSDSQSNSNSQTSQNSGGSQGNGNQNNNNPGNGKWK